MARSPRPKPRQKESPSLDLSDYSFEELHEIMKDVDGELEARRGKEVQDLRARVTEAAQTLGMSIGEIFGLSTKPRATRLTKHSRGKQPPKYRGPDGEEWSGRGPAPRWMKPYLAKGKSKEDFLIK